MTRFTSISSGLVLLILVVRVSTCFAQSFATPVTYSAGDSPNAVAIGDLNGDGEPDLAIANSVSQNVSVLLGNGDGTFLAKVDYAVGGNPNGVVIADVNSDSKPDLATANNLNSISVLLGNGNGTFGPKTDYALAAFSIPNDIVSGDLNGDNKPDLITVNQGSGAGFFLTTAMVPSAPQLSIRSEL